MTTLHLPKKTTYISSDAENRLMIQSIQRRSLLRVPPSSNPFAGGVAGVLLVLCLWLILGMRLVAEVPTYAVAEIPFDFYPEAINASGQMAGMFWPGGGAGRACLYSGGTFTNLGTLPGGDYSEATGINASGQVVGFSTTPIGDHAFLYSGGVMMDLGTLPYGDSSRATAINDAGQITGWSSTWQPGWFVHPVHAFIYFGGVMTDLGNIAPSYPTAWSEGYSINSSGQVVGWSDNDNLDAHAFLYSGGHMTDLGTLGGTESRATGINDSGTVVGWSNTTGDAATHAFKYAGGMTDLGTLPGDQDSRARAINSNGQIVGWSGWESVSSNPAFIYTDLTGMVQLDTHVIGDWRILDPFAINSAGQIGARGILEEPYTDTSVLLTPTGGPPHPAFFSGEVSVGNGIYYLQFPNGTPFGYYAYLTDPHFIYHFDMGYEYWFDANDGQGGIFFYDFASGHFFYTSPTFGFPYLYDFTLNTVLYYYPDPHNPGHYTTNPRYFYDFATGQIITM